MVCIGHWVLDICWFDGVRGCTRLMTVIMLTQYWFDGGYACIILVSVRSLFWFASNYLNIDIKPDELPINIVLEWVIYWHILSQHLIVLDGRCRYNNGLPTCNTTWHIALVTVKTKIWNAQYIYTLQSGFIMIRKHSDGTIRLQLQYFDSVNIRL